MPAAVLKLYSPESDLSTCSLTLDEVFREQIKPRLESRRRAASTIEDYERTIAEWCDFWSERGMHPELTAINEESLDLFAEHLALTRSGRTVNKHMGYLQTTLDLCGPARSGVTPLGRRLGLLASVPQHVRVEEDEAKRGRVATLEQVQAMLDHCHVATLPRYQSALKWSAAIRLLFWCGPRRCDLFRNLRRSHWLPSPVCPVPEVALEWPWGWIAFTPAKTARKKPSPLVIPLPQALHHELSEIQYPAGVDDPPLLGFASYPREWLATFVRIQEAAGISAPFTFQDARKSANVHWQQLVSPGTGSLFLGHSARGVNARHYSEDVVLMVKAAQLREGI